MEGGLSCARVLPCAPLSFGRGGLLAPEQAQAASLFIDLAVAHVFLVLAALLRVALGVDRGIQILLCRVLLDVLR